jgi:hypothetical protein
MVCHPLNLWAAYKQAARGKRYRPTAAAFEYDLEKNLLEIHKTTADAGTTQSSQHHTTLVPLPYGKGDYRGMASI